MSKLKFKLGDRVEFTETLTKQKVYNSLYKSKIIRKINELDSPKIGIIVGYRNFRIGEVGNYDGPIKLLVNNGSEYRIKAYLICDNINRVPYRVPVSNPVKAPDVQIGTENGIIHTRIL